MLKNGSFDNANNPLAFWNLRSSYKSLKKIKRINHNNAIFIDGEEINLFRNKNNSPIFQKIAVEPNTVYIFGCLIKTKNLKNRCYAYINEIYKRKGKKRVKKYETRSLEGDNDWEILYKFFKTDENVKQIIFFPIIIENFTNGQAWVDNCFLTKISSENWISNKEYHFFFNSIVSRNVNFTLRNSKPKEPIEFDLKIDGKHEKEKIHIGEKKVNPESIPFRLSDKNNIYNPYIKKHPDLTRHRAKNCFYIWRISPSFAPNKVKLSPETIRKLKALGYIN